MKKINIGIVGTGGMGKVHAHAYMLNPAAYVRGVCSQTSELARKFADGAWERESEYEGATKVRPLYRVEKVYDNYKEMAADPDIDAVSIITPNILHYEIALEMLKNNKHVLIEKPMTTCSNSARELVNAAAEKNLVIATGHMWRYHKDVEFVRNVIRDKMIGDVVQTKSYGLHLRWGPDGWFSRKAAAGGGALIDMGVHAIDTARFIIGEPKTESVYAFVGTKYKNYDVDDFAEIMVKFDNGVLSIFESGWNYPYISGTEASTEIWGTKGYARVFPTFVSMKIADRWGSFKLEESEEHDSLEPYLRQINDFINEINGFSRCLVSGSVGLEVMKIVDAAYESSTKNEVIYL